MVSASLFSTPMIQSPYALKPPGLPGSVRLQKAAEIVGKRCLVDKIEPGKRGHSFPGFTDSEHHFAGFPLLINRRIRIVAHARESQGRHLLFPSFEILLRIAYEQIDRRDDKPNAMHLPHRNGSLRKSPGDHQQKQHEQAKCLFHKQRSFFHERHCRENCQNDIGALIAGHGS